MKLDLKQSEAPLVALRAEFIAAGWTLAEPAPADNRNLYKGQHDDLAWFTFEPHWGAEEMTGGEGWPAYALESELDENKRHLIIRDDGVWSILMPDIEDNELSLMEARVLADELQRCISACAYLNERDNARTFTIHHEVARDWLKDHPEVLELIPSWVETVEAEIDEGRWSFSLGMTRGEVNAETTLTIDFDGTNPQLEGTTIYLPGDTRQWHTMTPAELAARVHDLSRDTAEIADALRKAASR